MAPVVAECVVTPDIIGNNFVRPYARKPTKGYTQHDTKHNDTVHITKISHTEHLFIQVSLITPMESFSWISARFVDKNSCHCGKSLCNMLVYSLLCENYIML